MKKIVLASGSEKGYVEIEIRQNFNAYCNYDGQIMKQKTFDQNNGNWANCQNNYECESNICSSGECIEVTQMIQNAKGFKNTFVKVFCKLAHLFSIENYEQCVADRLGEVASSTPQPSSGGGGGSGSSNSSSLG